MITKEEVKHIAKLARLGLTEEEITKFQRELSKILDYIEKLKEVDISKVEPTSHSITRVLAKGGDEASTSSTEVENIMRSDEFQIANFKLPGTREVGAKKLMELAPDKKNGYLKVRSILQNGIN